MRFLAGSAALMVLLLASPARGQDCTSVTDRCLASVSERVAGPYRTPSGGDALTLTFARLVRGVMTFPGGPVTGIEGFFGGTPRCPTTPMPSIVDAANRLDCWAVHINRVRPDGSAVVDGESCCYDPWRGAIFDLGGEGNRVAIFPVIDHGPLPCEAFEYTVWLTNNPDATTVAPATSPDPMRWNIAQLTRTFTGGWDTAIESDGYAMVYSLPCGVTFRYASLVAGNNGTPSRECLFHSFDAELDAVAGLNEDSTAVCPDRDGDGFRDAACGGNDCNDMDRMVNPGAVESCASVRDLNCDRDTPRCPEGLSCINGLCASACVESACGAGFTCVTPDGGSRAYCVPDPCAGVTCPDGQVCGPRGCQDPCMGARCPPGQVCRGGACVDPCAGLLCPTRQHCEAGRCVPDCPCIPCPAGTMCYTSGRCERPNCTMLRCPDGQVPDCTGGEPRCIRPCEEVSCPLGTSCDRSTQRCVTDRCFGVGCPADTVCMDGRCVRPPRPDAGPMDAAAPDATEPADTAPRDTGSGSDRGAAMDAPGDTGLVLDTADGPGSCGCRVPGEGARGTSLALALAALGRCRRRRRAA
ncbi:MAG: hypothetical protein HY909_15045 [Deltaproteobacteria bacterium]|nr:hypothetical protein [Deltaproteobacteria bacterium]